MQAERAHEHTHSPTPQPGVAGRSRNTSPNTHTHTAHPCQDWLGASGARTRARTRTAKNSWKNIDKFIGSALDMSVLSQFRKR